MPANLRLFYCFILVYCDFYKFDIVSKLMGYPFASFIFYLSFPLEESYYSPPFLGRDWGRGLLSRLTIHANRDGAVVDECHFHVGSKASCGDVSAELGRQFGTEKVVEWHGYVVCCGPNP